MRTGQSFPLQLDRAILNFKPKKKIELRKSAEMGKVGSGEEKKLTES